MSMHSDFSEWFHAAGIQLQDDVLQKRWAGVDAFQVGVGEIISLTEVFYGFFDHKDSFLAEFRKSFQATDSAFRMRDNNQELSVLAGAALVDAMERCSTELGDFAALSLVSCAAQNLRPSPSVVDIPERAVKHLSRRSVNRGELDLGDEAKADENKAEIMQLRHDLDVIREESNVLWWVFGETSRDTDQRWAKYSVPQTAIMAGKELADLTRIAPGPAAATSLLDRVVKYAKAKPPAQVAVKDAIADVIVEWRQKFARDGCPVALANLRPISQGIKMSVDLAAGDAWVSVLASSTKIKRDGKIAPRLLAYQVFVECVLASLWLKMK